MTPRNLVYSLAWIALSAIPSVADHNQWINAMKQAEIAKDAGRLADAGRAYQDAIRASLPHEGLELDHAIALAKHASILHDMQRTRESEKGYLNALRILRGLPREAVQRQMTAVIISLAALYIETGQPSKAVSLNVERILPTVESRADLANSYGILGSIAFAENRHADAEAWWQQSAALCELEHLMEDAAVSLANLGLLKATKGDFKNAVVYFRRSVERFTTSIGLEHPRSVKAQANLGHSLFRLGREREGTEWLEKAHRLAQQWYGAENPITIQLCMDHAEALRRSGRKNEAKALMEAVRQLPAAAKAALPGRSTVDVLQMER